MGSFPLWSFPALYLAFNACSVYGSSCLLSFLDSSALVPLSSLHPSSTIHSAQCLGYEQCHPCLLNTWLKLLHVSVSIMRVNWEVSRSPKWVPKVSLLSTGALAFWRQWINCVPFPHLFMSVSAVEEKVVQWWSRRWKAKFQFTMSWNNPFFQEVPEIAWETT